MTREQAIKKLRNTGALSTGMLKPLGISFEYFLRFSQFPKQKAAEAITEMIIRFN